MSLIVFNGHHLVAQGDVPDVLQQACRYSQQHPDAALLIMNSHNAQLLHLDLSQPLTVLERQVAIQNGDQPQPLRKGRGRPKLGVVSREVSLLPRHWQWLETQPGGVSAVLRTLIEQARKAPEHQLKDGQRAVDQALSTLAGDLPHYEEVLRQFYRRQYHLVYELMATWPDDVQRYCRELVKQVQAIEVGVKPQRRER